MQVPVTSTADTYLRYVRGRCRIGATPPTVALQQEALLAELHDINEEFCNFPSSIGALPFKFLEREQLFNTYAGTTLSVATSVNDTTATLTSGTNWDSPSATELGAGYLKTSLWAYDFFSFTSRSSAVLSGVYGLDIAHSASDRAEKLYMLNSDYGKPRQLFVDGYPYDFIDMDFGQVPPMYRYTTKFLSNSDASISRAFIVMPEYINTHTCTFVYVKRPNTISTTTDKVDAPDGTARKFIMKRLEAYCWTMRGEMDLAAAANIEARGPRWPEKVGGAIGMFMDEMAQQQVSPNQNPTFDL